MVTEGFLNDTAEGMRPAGPGAESAADTTRREPGREASPTHSPPTSWLWAMTFQFQFPSAGLGADFTGNSENRL